MRPRTSLLIALALSGLAGAVSVPEPVDAQGLQAPAPSPPRPRGNLAPRVRAYTYYIDEGNSADGYHRGDRELATWALHAWERVSGGTLRFVAAPEASPRIRITWVGAREGQYGETVRAPGNRRASIVYLTCLHELGHAIGLAHTSDERDIMYSFQFGGDIRNYFYRYRDQIKRREDIAAESGLSANDVERVRTMFAGR